MRHQSAFVAVALLAASGCMLWTGRAAPIVPVTQAERAAFGCYRINAAALYMHRFDRHLHLELDSEQVIEPVRVGHTSYTWRVAWMDGAWGRYRMTGDTLEVAFGPPERYGLTFVMRPPPDDSAGIAAANLWMAFEPAFTRAFAVPVRRLSCDDMLSL